MQQACQFLAVSSTQSSLTWPEPCSCTPCSRLPVCSLGTDRAQAGDGCIAPQPVCNSSCLCSSFSTNSSPVRSAHCNPRNMQHKMISWGLENNLQSLLKFFITQNTTQSFYASERRQKPEQREQMPPAASLAAEPTAPGLQAFTASLPPGKLKGSICPS